MRVPERVSGGGSIIEVFPTPFFKALGVIGSDGLGPGLRVNSGLGFGTSRAYAERLRRKAVGIGRLGLQFWFGSGSEKLST